MAVSTCPFPVGNAASPQQELTANDDANLPPWVSGEFDVAAFMRAAPRLLTKEQFIDHIDRQREITRRSIDWRFALFMVNIAAVEDLKLRGESASEQFVRAAAEKVAMRLNPRDAVAVMRDQCFAALIEVPLLQAPMEDIAVSIQHDVAELVAETDSSFDPACTIGVAKVSRNYGAASEVVRDAGLALKEARIIAPGSVMIFNRSMELPEIPIVLAAETTTEAPTAT